MSLRKGELSFEGILLIAIVSVILATLIAVLQFQSSRNPSPSDDSDIIRSYDSILKSLRNDAKFAATCVFDSHGNGVKIYNGSNEEIAHYLLRDKQILRISKSVENILCSGIMKAEFKMHNDLPNLLIVTLMPENKMQIPFFTSFALRVALP